VQDTRPGEKSFMISALDRLEDWDVQNRRDVELETYDFLNRTVRTRREGFCRGIGTRSADPGSFFPNGSPDRDFRPAVPRTGQ
jgi:hypothetical protein